ncbi:MAG: nicotinate-nucleotide--dimethylbenzimidazole phosphoribosyltransferase, partial [Psychromonas sp.]|nr:nicotinate-nucleotide--dimethylbenzimidazole phosphoribosyltransferase [Psychromonas sp.]
KEYKIFGSYGLARNHIPLSIPIIKKYASVLEHLIEEHITPEETNTVLNAVLNGEKYRYIIDIAGSENRERRSNQSDKISDTIVNTRRELSVMIDTLIAGIENSKSEFLPEVQHAIDNKTKPLGSLGKLESLAVKCALIQNSLSPKIEKKWTMVFAADHGIAVEGVSAYPSEVTGQMVINFLNGGAAINTLCKATGAGLSIVDMGVNADFTDEASIINRKVRKGTSNFTVMPAMAEAEVILAIEGGISAFNELYDKNHVDIMAMGEMGIGNTCSASAITSVICGIPVSQVTGRGTGVDDVGLEHKQEVLRKALAFHNPKPNDALDILSKVGGFEIAGMAGAMIAGACKGIVIVLDGFISTAAALIAQLLCAASTDYFIAGHKSVEIGHIAALNKLGLEPILDLDMRLGEGTGATLTMDLASTAVKLLSGMASFDEAGISRK